MKRNARSNDLIEEDNFRRSFGGLYYDPRDPNNLGLYHARQVFLRSAARVVPDFVNEFMKMIPPTFAEATLRNLRNEPRPANGAPDAIKAAQDDQDAYFLSDVPGKKPGALIAWAERFNIKVPWVIGEAWFALAGVIIYQNKGLSPTLAFGTWRPRLPKPQTLWRPELPDWDPTAESLTEYRRRCQKQFKVALDTMISEKTSSMARSGFHKIPTRREGRASVGDRYEWAALLQCTSITAGELAEEYGADAETIRIDAGRILHPLGLPSRT